MAHKNTCPTLKKVTDAEPIFVLRAQDITSPQLILEWLKLNPQISAERRREAFDCIDEMHAWPKKKSAD
jgi:hypothetical protein